MRKTALVLVTAAAFVVSFGAVVLAQAKPGSASVQGVWKVAEIAVTGGPNAGTVAQPQPGFFVFTRSHYSVVRINGSGPRPKFTIKDLAKPTDAEKLAAYAGTTPRVHASGGKTRFGPSRPDVNRYLKWAFGEAANAICLNRTRAPRRHVSRLYERVARRKGHQKAIGAVARHLAEATYWILTKQETYRDPNAAAVSSTGDKRG